jgi:arsenate reductase
MNTVGRSTLFEKIEQSIKALKPEGITESRKEVLKPLVDYIQEKANHNREIRLNFICTHNSRRSHLSQVWAQALAFYVGLKNVNCYSGGTEATALFPRVVDTLEKSGFEINEISKGHNKVFSIKYAANEPPVIGFSKTYDDDFNPVSGYAAIMTCSEADAGCPYIAGAELRIPVTYDDPKAFDNTSQQAEKYLERSLQIATELLYVFIQINL